MPAVIRHATTLEAPIESVLALLERPALLRHISFPLIVFQPREKGGFPARWTEGDHRVFMWQFGFLPIGPQTVSISRGKNPDGSVWIRDDGHGSIARRWDHRITIAVQDAETTLYEDEVALEAGWLTPAVAGFAHVFYRWRQFRWRALARNQALQRRLLKD